MTDSDLRQELRRLTRRLERLERLLDVQGLDSDSPAPDEAPPVAPQVAPRSVTPPPAIEAPSLPPRASIAAGIHEPSAKPADSPKPDKAAAFHRVAASSAPSLVGATGAAPKAAPLQGLSPRSALRGERKSSPPRDGRSLERAIGERWMAWVGALAIVIGAALFVKLAYDNGWLESVSISMRCALAATFGFLLLIAGEVALRKVGRAASVGLFGAGLGTLYVTTLVSSRFEVLGSAGVALILLAAAAALGIGVAVRARLLSIAVLSIIAGYGAPLLIPDAGAFAAAMPLYLTMVLVVGLALSAVQPRPFRTVRIVTLAAHAALATLWIAPAYATGGLLELAFMAGWWMMITGEAVFAAIRRQTSLGNAIISLLATTWFVLFGCVLLNSSAAAPSGLSGAFAAGVGVLAGAIALQFGPGLDALRRRPQNAMEKLAASLWIQAGALIAIAAALHFSDYGMTIAWLLLGLAAIEIGRRLPSVAVDRFGLVVGALGLLRLLTIDLVFGVNVAAITAGTLVISQWTLLALGGAAVLQVAAWRLRVTGSDLRRVTAAVLLTSFAIMWLLLTQVTLVEHGMAVTVAWIAGAVAFIAIGGQVRRLPYLAIGAYLLGFTAMRWISIDMLNVRFAALNEWIAQTPLLNSGALVGATIIAGGGVLLWAGARSQRDRAPGDRRPAAPIALAMAVLAMVLLSMEIDRAVAIYEHAQGESLRQRWAAGQLDSLWLTLVWGLAGLFTALFGAWRGHGRAFTIGTWAASVCCGAWLAWDTLYYRVTADVAQAPVIINLQFLVGLVLAIGLGAGLRAMGYRRSANGLNAPMDPSGEFGRVAIVLIGCIGLWLGSLEIDRLFNPETSAMADAAMARQTGLSIYWGVYGIMLVVLGFVFRTAVARYAGLALLAVTLVKVLAVDMRDVQYIYRVMSFIGVGLLFVLTSIAYARLSPRLLTAGRAGQEPVAE